MGYDVRKSLDCSKSKCQQEEMHLKWRDFCHLCRFGFGVSGTDVGVRSCGVLGRFIPRDTLGGVAIPISTISDLEVEDDVELEDEELDDEDDDEEESEDELLVSDESDD